MIYFRLSLSGILQSNIGIKLNRQFDKGGPFTNKDLLQNHFLKIELIKFRLALADKSLWKY